ncbi:MAG TPA: pyridoxal-phosphate dependent enzyme [Actinocrinis sp.]|nr:pyridoxal-phosphate dependent enzyme [Actinocrinis sp.]
MNVGAGAAIASSFTGAPAIGPADVKAAAGRIAARVRPVTLVAADTKPFDESSVYLACETTQVTGSFEARGAANLALYHLEHGALPEAGTVTAVCGNGNAALACAWAARESGSRATVFATDEPDSRLSDLTAHLTTHRSARARLMRRLIEYGAEVHSVEGGSEQAARAAADHAQRVGALFSHPSDNPLIAVGAGTLAAEINELIGAEIDTIVVTVGGGLVAGTCAALEHTGIRVVPVEPQRSRTLSAALEAGFPIDAPGADDTTTPAADSLGARRVSQLTLDLARAAGCVPVQVTDEEIACARQSLWDQRRIPAEYGAAAAFAAIQSGAYVPDVYERVVVVIGGGNTDPATLES